MTTIWNWCWTSALLLAVCIPVVAGADESEAPKRRQLADLIGTERIVRDDAIPGESHPNTPFGSSTEIGDGLAWLEGNQNGDGSWGSSFELIVTSTVLETLGDVNQCSTGTAPGGTWLESEGTANYEFLARKTAGLADVPGFEETAKDLAFELLALRNPSEFDDTLPNWPEGGWGIAEGFETDSLTTSLALLALDETGFNGGFSVSNGAVAPGATNIHEWEIPEDATKVRILITVGGSQIRLCMTEGAPPPFCSSFFPLLGGPFEIVFPDSGLPFTPGTNFVVIESTGPAATYTFTASYETPTFDTRSLAEPLAYLREAQNVDGGWGIQRGQSTEAYTTLHTLLAVQEFGQYEFDTEIANAISWLESQQLGDGSFGFGGPGIPYVTALAVLNLVRSQSSPFSMPTEDAVTALLAQQEVDGSWDQEAYDTALAMVGLRAYDEPPTADAGPDQFVGDVDGNCEQAVTLSGSGEAVNGSIVSYEWTEDCVSIASGASPTVDLGVGPHTVTLTVTDSDGSTDSDSLYVFVSDAADADEDDVSLCAGDCNDSDPSVWATPSEALGLTFSDDENFSWTGPEELGGFLVVHDVLRSEDPSDFLGAGTFCVESDDSVDTVAQDPDTPASGAVYFYLVRAENDCPDGLGSLGNDSIGTPRTGLDCS